MELLKPIKQFAGRLLRDVSRRGAPGPGQPSGHLIRAPQLTRSSRLRRVPLSELSGELLGRITEGAFNSELTVGIGCDIQDALSSALDIHPNRLSRRHYRMFGRLPGQFAPHLLRLEGATVVDVGCGSINPYGILFLYLMLGARRGIAIDPDPIQDHRRAVKALADCAALMLLNPGDLVGDYPIDRAQALANVGTFDLGLLQAGDAGGLDDARLQHRQDRVGALSLEDGEADLVISNSFLEHVADVETSIADLARITRPGGVGVHRIDGADHKRYWNAAADSLEFLTDATDAPPVGDCNRVRPLDFVPVFERHGFEVMIVTPFEVRKIGAALQARLVEPFRSRPPEVLGVIGAEFVVQRRQRPVRGTGVPLASLAAGWTRPSLRTSVPSLVRERRFAEALELLKPIQPDSPDFARTVGTRGWLRYLLRDHEGADLDLTRAIELSSPRPETFVWRAWLRLEQGRSADGLADALRARQLLPPGDPLDLQLCGVLALLYAREGQHAPAMTLLDDLVQRHPERAVVHLWRGWAFFLAGDPTHATAAADAARACDPELDEIRQLTDAMSRPVTQTPARD
jgi:SAM-dependent methyltransferase